MFHGLRECQIPFLENSPGVFADNLGTCSPCSPGEKWSVAAGLCVLDTDIIVNPPATAPSNFMMYAGIGLGLLLLLGAFAGGRASKSSVATGTRKRVTKSFWVTF